MPKGTWIKGKKVEQMVVRKLNDINDVQCDRRETEPFVERNKGNIDLVVKRKIGNQKFNVTLKARKSDYGFKNIREWLANNFNHFLIIAEDNKVPLVVMDYHIFKHILDNFEPKAKWPPNGLDGKPVTFKDQFSFEDKVNLTDIGSEVKDE